jgi:hypothetical protein
MDRHRFIKNTNEDKNNRPFHACERCGKIYKKDYSCCTSQPLETKPSDRLPKNESPRPSFRSARGGRFAPEQTAFDQIWGNAREEMDATIDEPRRPPSEDDFEDY